MKKIKQNLLKSVRGDARALSAIGISVLILVILGSMAALVGNELENASGLSYNYDGGGNNDWENLTHETGTMAEDGFNILAVGVILAVILAAVGFIIFPYLRP